MRQGSSSSLRAYAPSPGASPLDRVLTAHPPFQDLLRQLPRLAATDLPVLITGEPGTGKELVAEALWALSPRRSQAFHRVNCALFGGELATSELFGHQRGSFTGAVQRRLGKFQQAHRGTLFLDEVGDLDPAVQPRLLRVLEQGEVEPLGSDVATKVDVRLLSATNQAWDSFWPRAASAGTSMTAWRYFWFLCRPSGSEATTSCGWRSISWTRKPGAISGRWWA